MRLNKEENLPVSIIMGDVNGLKFINIGIEHSKGMKCLLKLLKFVNSSNKCNRML